MLRVSLSTYPFLRDPGCHTRVLLLSRPYPIFGGGCCAVSFAGQGVRRMALSRRIHRLFIYAVFLALTTLKPRAAADDPVEPGPSPGGNNAPVTIQTNAPAPVIVSPRASRNGIPRGEPMPGTRDKLY